MAGSDLSPLAERLLVLFARNFPIRRGKLRAVDRLWRTAAKGTGTRRLAQLKYGGFVMSCDIDEILQRQFYFFGTYFLEEHILDAWRQVAKGAKTILDVGANAGIYSLAALAAEPAAAVYAFEPTPEIAAQLRQTASLNGLQTLHVQEMAISDINGYARLERCRGDDGTNGGMNFIATGAATAGPGCVSTVRLDDFCDEHGIERVDLVKIDVQGHEYAALMGAQRLIGAGRLGTVFLELNWAPDAGGVSPAQECISLLEHHGYEFAAPDENSQWQRSGAWMRRLTDVCARPVLRN